MASSSSDLSDWQSEFDSISNLPEEQYLEALRKQMDKLHAPKSVNDMLKRMLNLLKGCKEREQAKANEVSEYSRKILSVYDHYTILEEMYKTEHKTVLNLKDEKAELQAKILDLTKNSSEQQANDLKKKLDAQRDEFNKQATKQALGRKKIEEKLMFKEIDYQSVKKKLQEIEAQNASLQLEVQNSKYFLQYYLTPQQQSQVAVAQQQHLIQQQQQQQQQQQKQQQQQQQQQQQ